MEVDVLAQVLIIAIRVKATLCPLTERHAVFTHGKHSVIAREWINLIEYKGVSVNDWLSGIKTINQLHSRLSNISLTVFAIICSFNYWQLNNIRRFK
jgi:hypothetical protein